MIKTIVKFCKKIKPVKKNKKLVLKLVENKIISSSDAVIKLISNFKNIENDILGTSYLVLEDNLYIRFCKFLDSNRKGHKLPKGPIINKALGIDDNKRKELAKESFNKGVLVKGPNGYYQFNINWEGDFQ